MWRHVIYVLAGLSSAACAATSTVANRPFLRNTGRDVITATEIVAIRVTDAYQAVVQLRPEFLRRGTPLPGTPHRAAPIDVYMDGLLLGGTETLRSVPLERVRLIRYVSATEAQLRWGGAHPAGVIFVTTAKP